MLRKPDSRVKLAGSWGLLAAACLLSGCAALGMGYEKFTAKPDKFQGTTVYTWDAESGVWYRPRLSFTAEQKGREVPPSIDASINMSSPDWQYLRCHDVTFLVDGERMPYSGAQTGNAGYNDSMRMAEVYERVSFQMPIADAIKIANAGTVEYQVCRDEHEMLPKDQEGLRKVLDGLGVGR